MKRVGFIPKLLCWSYWWILPSPHPCPGPPPSAGRVRDQTMEDCKGIKYNSKKKKSITLNAAKGDWKMWKENHYSINFTNRDLKNGMGRPRRKYDLYTYKSESMTYDRILTSRNSRYLENPDPKITREPVYLSNSSPKITQWQPSP